MYDIYSVNQPLLPIFLSKNWDVIKMSFLIFETLKPT